MVACQVSFVNFLFIWVIYAKWVRSKSGQSPSVLYWLLERCQYSILVAFASILKILQYPGGCQYTGSGGQYTGSGCLTYCHYMAVRLVLLQCFGVLH